MASNLIDYLPSNERRVKMSIFQVDLINVVMVSLTVCVGITTRYAVSYLKKKGIIHQLETKKELAKIAVTAIEQIYKYSHGEEKLNLAKVELLRLLEKKNIKVSEQELNLLIESMVREMNKAVKDELEK